MNLEHKAVEQVNNFILKFLHRSCASQALEEFGKKSAVKETIDVIKTKTHRPAAERKRLRH